jgi:hypothetical protein
MGNSESKILEQYEEAKKREYREYIITNYDRENSVFYSKKINMWVSFIQLFQRNNIIGFYANKDEAILKVKERQRQIIGCIENNINNYDSFKDEINQARCGNDYYLMMGNNN